MTVSLLAGCAGTSAQPAQTPAPAATQAPATTEAAVSTEQSASAGSYPYSVVMTTNRALDAATFEDVYEKAPEHIVCSGFQMLYILLDLGLQDRIAGMLSAPGTESKACYKSELIPIADGIPRLGKSSEVSKEELVALNCDFLMGWDSLFSDKNYNPEFCNQYGMVQENSVEFDMPVIEMVMLGRYVHRKHFQDTSKEDLAIARRYLAEVGLPDFEERSFRSLSGGEKQRVLVARALAQDTKYKTHAQLILRKDGDYGGI